MNTLEQKITELATEINRLNKPNMTNEESSKFFDLLQKKALLEDVLFRKQYPMIEEN